MRSLLVLAPFLLVLACQTERTDVAGDPGTGGIFSHAGGGSGGGTGGGAGGGAGFGRLTGSVRLDTQPSFYSATASFAAQLTADGCTLTANGGCTLVSCPAAAADGGTFSSAGNVQVLGGVQAVTLVPNANGRYSVGTGAVRLWTGGETLQISGFGADGGVPAFSTALVAPTPVTVAGWPSGGATMNIPRSSDLALSWTGTTTGKVHVLLTAGATQSIACDFVGPSGSVPTALLAQLPAGGGTISVTAQNLNTVAAGSWDVTVLGSTLAAAQGGGNAFATATLQ